MVMGNNAVSPYQQVIEKTKSLSFRSQMLAMNIEKKISHSSRNEVPDSKQTKRGVQGEWTEVMSFSFSLASLESLPSLNECAGKLLLLSVEAFFP